MKKTIKPYIEAYFVERKLDYKESGNNQFLVKDCPVCGDDKFHHVYMNQDSGLWDCKKCFTQGNFNSFRKANGDGAVQIAGIEVPERDNSQKTYRKLNPDLDKNYAARLIGMREDMMDYLKTKRGLTEATIKHFKLGVSDDGNISIPIYEDGKMANIRYRRDPAKDGQGGPKYIVEKGCKSALFNGDVLKKANLQEIFVTEGEFDAMSLIQAGITNTVSVTLGAGGFSPEWAEKMENLKTVYLCYDSDEAGKRGMAKAVSVLGEEKVRIIQIPPIAGKPKADLNDYFMSGKTKADFLSLVKNSKKPSDMEELIKHLSEFNEELRDRLLNGEYFGLLSGFEGLDDIVGGLRKGRLIIISGLTNVGKTTFAMNMALNIVDQRLPVFFLSLEMPSIDIAKKIMMLRTKLTNVELGELKDPSPELKTIDKALDTFLDKAKVPMYLFNGVSVKGFKELRKICHLAVKEYKCQCIFIDHLQYLVQNYSNLTAETSKIVREIKGLARELDIPIVLLAHLNRGGRSKSRKGLYIPNLSDLRDSGAIEQDADQVFFVCRDSESEDDEEREKSILKVSKNRDGSAGRSISMKFEEGWGAFAEVKGVNFEQDAKDDAKAKSSEVALPDAETALEEPEQDDFPF